MSRSGGEGSWQLGQLPLQNPPFLTHTPRNPKGRRPVGAGIPSVDRVASTGASPMELAAPPPGQHVGDTGG